MGCEPAPVAAGSQMAQQAATHTLSSAEYIGSEIKRHKRGVLLLLAALLATTIIVSYFAYSRYVAGRSKAGITSIAVLPFANKTGDPNAEYLSDGISESLINSLSQLPDVKVIARSSAFKYKGKETDLKEVAKALGVEAILTGRVTQRGENLSISVELVNASDKTQMWGEQYDRKMSDLLAIQREIARRDCRETEAQSFGRRERACQTLHREQRGLSALFERPLPLEQADGRSAQEINRVFQSGD